MPKPDWEPSKNRWNKREHGIDFNTAAQIWTSGYEVVERFDDQHSDHEDRFKSYGVTSSGIVVVVHTERDEGNIRWIISAWKADGYEIDYYNSYRR